MTTDAARPEGTGRLETFLAGAGSLTRDDRLTIVNQAIIMLEGFYAHLPLKRAMHAVDPLQRLRLVRRRIDQLGADTRFHAEMTAIFTSVRDLHTNYLLPPPYNAVEAWLPILVEACFEDGARRFIVTKIGDWIEDPDFRPGVEITHWNGAPIERAVANAAERHAGSNPAARFSNGLAGLTLRPLILVPPPDEEWVTISFLDSDGQPKEIRLDWEAWGVPEQPPEAGPVSPQAARRGLDLQAVAVQRARQRLFAPQVTSAAAQIAAAGGGPPAGADSSATSMPHNFLAKTVVTEAGAFGYIRIWSFGDDGNQFNDGQVFLDSFVAEFTRLIELMPREGLIVDVRDNGGGFVNAGERILQLMTPRQVEPERFQFINTQQTQSLAAAYSDLSPWEESITQAIETGAIFSSAVPLTDPDSCNDLGQRYHGPVVLITSARCYSTTDMFAAGFQDHDIGPVLGVDDNTGAGGANVWDFDLLGRLMPETFSPLPAGVGMRVAIRRSLRVGARAGTELEDLGVKSDVTYAMTRRDLLQGNVDLIERAAALLAPARRFRLDAALSRAAGLVTLDVTTLNIDRVDVALDDRPLDSVDVADGARTIDLPAGAAGKLLIRGYRQAELVAARRLDC